MTGEATLYWCDPEKNTACRKMSCRYVLRKCEGGVCEATFRRAYARTDENGVPMVYEERKEREEREHVQGTD